VLMSDKGCSVMDDLKRSLWTQYQEGQASADHTAYEVFVETVGPLMVKIEEQQARIAVLEGVYEAAKHYHYVSGRAKDANKLFAAIAAVDGGKS